MAGQRYKKADNEKRAAIWSASKKDPFFRGNSYSGIPRGGCPLAELSGPFGIDAVPNRDYGIETVVFEIPRYLAVSFSVNCSEFPNSCRAVVPGFVGGGGGVDGTDGEDE